MSATVQRRRRGQELESALLDAAWLEMTQVGTSNLTMESVAKRAHTGAAVLYRRWPNKEALVIAALQHYRNENPVVTPDTGTLRGDLVGVLSSLSMARASVFAVAGAAYLSGLISSDLHNPEQARRKIVGERIDPRTRPVYMRAEARHELNMEAVPASVLALPFDLVSYELMKTFAPVEPERINSIVDDIVLPLLRRYHKGALA